MKKLIHPKLSVRFTFCFVISVLLSLASMAEIRVYQIAGTWSENGNGTVDDTIAVFVQVDTEAAPSESYVEPFGTRKIWENLPGFRVQYQTTSGLSQDSGNPYFDTGTHRYAFISHDYDEWRSDAAFDIQQGRNTVEGVRGLHSVKVAMYEQVDNGPPPHGDRIAEIPEPWDASHYNAHYITIRVYLQDEQTGEVLQDVHRNYVLGAIEPVAICDFKGTLIEVTRTITTIVEEEIPVDEKCDKYRRKWEETGKEKYYEKWQKCLNDNKDKCDKYRVKWEESGKEKYYEKWQKCLNGGCNNGSGNGSEGCSPSENGNDDENEPSKCEKYRLKWEESGKEKYYEKWQKCLNGDEELDKCDKYRLKWEESGKESYYNKWQKCLGGSAEGTVTLLTEVITEQIWVNDCELSPDGWLVFENLELAARNMDENGEIYPSFAEYFHELKVLFANISSDLARNLLEQARSANGNPARIELAEEELALGDDAFAMNNLEEAIFHYGRAWGHALAAIEE